jgi:tetratricopeptide (TPR) repeat protein
MRRFDDALLVAQTAQKLDPYNNQFQYLISEIEGIKKSAAQFSQPADQLEKDVSRLEGETKANPTNFVRQFELAQKLLQLGQTDRTIQVLDGVITNPQANADILTAVAAAYGQLGKMDKLENVLEKLTRIDSNSPEAWYDLAGSRAVLNQTAPAIAALKQALDLSSKRLASNPKAADLRVRAASDPEFNNVRNTPEFKALLAH